MIRLTATGLVVFYVLVLATTAHAECAWVLWVKYENVNSGRAPCGDGPTGGGFAVRTEFMQPQHSSSYVEFRCFPDTIDPRGPKGK